MPNQRRIFFWDIQQLAKLIGYIFNEKTLVVEESIHITFDDSNINHLERNIEDDENILEDKVNESDEQVI